MSAPTRTDIDGPVLERGDPGVAAELAGYQTGPAHDAGEQTGSAHDPGDDPALVVGATGPDDVAAAVVHAVARDLPVRIRATGHGLGGGTDGVVVTTRRMAGVAVDPATATARVEAGATVGDLVAAAGRHGLAPVSGSSPGVGVVGYTLGAGFGLLGRAFGYASDRVRAARVVTAEGERRRLDGDDALLRVIRGGRDVPAVVTALEVGLVPLPEVVAASLLLDASDPATADAVTDTYLALTGDAPDGLALSLGAVTLPDVPALPPAWRGRPTVTARVVAVPGEEAAAQRAVAAFRPVAPVLAGDVQRLPWTRSGEISAEPGEAHAYEGDALLCGAGAGGVSAGALGRVVAAAGPLAPEPCVVDVRHLGGAFAASVTGAPDAVSHRGATHLVRVVSGLDGRTRAAVRARHDAALQPVAAGGLGRAGTFLYGATRAVTPAERVHAPGVLADLRAVAARLDPAGRFARP